jgi:hypothetical protein
MPDEGVGQRHLQLLRAIDEVARRDAAGVATAYRAAEKVGLNIVGKEADREEFVRLARDLEDAGYVDVYEVTYLGLRGSYSATEEGRRRLEERRFRINHPNVRSTVHLWGRTAELDTSVNKEGKGPQGFARLSRIGRCGAGGRGRSRSGGRIWGRQDALLNGRLNSGLDGLLYYHGTRRRSRGGLFSITTNEPDKEDSDHDSDNHPHTQPHKECLRGHLPFQISKGGPVPRRALARPPL